MIRGLVIWTKANLTFTEYIFFFNKSLYPGIWDTTEYFSQVAVDTDLSVVIGVCFVTIFIDWSEQNQWPGSRHQESSPPVEQFNNCSLKQQETAVFVTPYLLIWCVTLLSLGCPTVGGNQPVAVICSLSCGLRTLLSLQVFLGMADRVWQLFWHWHCWRNHFH